MPSPTCEVKDGAGSYGSTAAGVNVTSGHMITIRLADSNVDSWTIQCITTDETNIASQVQASLTIDALNKTASFSAPAVGSALRFRSQVNNGVGPDGVAKPSYTTTFCIYTLVGGNRVVAADETTERGASGWVASLNAAIRGTSIVTSPTITGNVTHQGVKGNIYSIWGEFTSVGAVTDSVAVFAMPDECTCLVDFSISMKAVGAVAKAGSLTGTATYYRTGGGAPTLIGSIEYGTAKFTTGGDGVVIQAVSNNLEIIATSADSDNRNWTCEARFAVTFAT